MAIGLGDKVRDMVTGFSGIAVARTEWINGCVRWCVQSDKLKDGKPADEIWFDDGRLSLVKFAAVKVRVADTGGPQKDPRAPEGR